MLGNGPAAGDSDTVLLSHDVWQTKFGSDGLKLILRSGMSLVVIGLMIGLAGALALTRLMNTLLYEVSPTDPITFGTVALSVILATLLACYIPARRATKVDPLVALRYE